ncbi:uncharacterized protein TM35_000881000 [Trypanosoma theileri]|uniref:Uncharacterized protein n=1 Tax=Trypanosoma theileri TaxID=67003 RepID=A0A1X0NEI3_9TRYP|nr:uncharacterized protein TM35_000881000 [Trypanosoma theileri]ORC82521.1 hypothetical protein TM35_000881000 [Trypanosoma theileri]
MFKLRFFMATRSGKFTIKYKGHWAQLAKNIFRKRDSSPTSAAATHRHASNGHIHVRAESVVIQGFRESFGGRWCMGAFTPHMIPLAEMRAVYLALHGFKIRLIDWPLGYSHSHSRGGRKPRP